MSRKKLNKFYSLLLSFSIILNTLGYSFANEPVDSNKLNVNTLKNNVINNEINSNVEKIDSTSTEKNDSNRGGEEAKKDNSISDIKNIGNQSESKKNNEDKKAIEQILDVTVKPNKTKVNINDSFIYTISYNIQNYDNDTCDLIIDIPDNLTILNQKSIENAQIHSNRISIKIDTSDKNLISKSIDIEVKFKQGSNIGDIAKAKVTLGSNPEVISEGTVLENTILSSISSKMSATQVAGKEEFTYNLSYDVENSSQDLKLVINVPKEIIDILEITETNSSVNKVVSEDCITYTIKPGNNLSNKISIRMKFKDKAPNGSYAQITSKLLTMNDIDVDSNTSSKVELIKPLVDFNIQSSKNIVKPGEEFKYTINYEMISANQDEATIVVDVPKELDVISFENIDKNIVEQTYNAGKIIYKIKTKDIERIKGNLEVRVKFKKNVDDGTKASLSASVNYPTEYTIYSTPVILNDFSVADVSITPTEKKVLKDGEYSYVVNFTSQGNKDPLKLTIQLSDTLDILAANDLVGIQPIIDKNNNTVIFEVPPSKTPISAQLEIRVKFKSDEQNGAIGNAIATINKEDVAVREVESSNTILEINPKLEIIKNLITSDSITPNSTAKYRITIKNKENINLKEFKLKDILPKEAIFVDATLKDSNLIEIPNTLIDNKNGEVIATVPIDYNSTNLYLEVTVEYKNLVIGSKITNNAEIYDNTNNYINKASISNLVQEKQGEGVLSKLSTNRVNSSGGSQGWNLYVKNYGNVAFDKFILKDKIPYENNIYIINSGKYESYDKDTTMNINIKTNKREMFNVAKLTGDELSIGKQVNLNNILSKGEYMTDYEVVIENIPVGFTYNGWSCMRLDGNVRNKHEDGTFIQNNETITNTATLEYISKDIKGTVKDSDSFLFKTAYTACVEKQIIARSTGVNTIAEYELVTRSPKRNLPKPIVFDIIPDGMEYVDYEINVKDNNGNIISSPLTKNFKFEKVQEKDKEIVRWIFNENLPQNYTISIKLKLKQIKNKTFINNEMGVSTQNINGEIRGVYGIQGNEMDTPIDKLKPDSVEPIGYDYDGNGNKGGDIYAKATAEYNIGNKTGLTVEKYIKNEEDKEYSTEVTSKKGSTINYKLDIINTTEKDVIKDLSIVDILPSKGDKNLLSTSERGSLFSPTLVKKFKIIYNGKQLSDSDYKISYSNSNNPERNAINGTLGSGKWIDDITNVDDIKSVKFDINNVELKPKDKLEIYFDMIIPNNVEDNLYAINSFQASFKDIRGSLLYPVESNKVIAKTPSVVSPEKPPVISPEKPPVISPEKPPVISPE
ncbi:hypothetical protein, partial [Romboutsia sp. MSSM.1001216sp_RTP31141st1_G3_RTP31141_220114]|uniref:hypothetical protein n=1 Tax=unclassified Romboutsia TaxID=2626894 RepID=UPI0031B59372